MAQRKITENSIADGAISTSTLGSNIEFSGEYIAVPSGTTAQRPSTPAGGMIRYNTDFGKLEQYGTGGWASLDTPPTITGLSYSGSLLAADPAGGETITLTGANFQEGFSVFVNDVLAPSTTFISSTEVQFTTPAVVAGDYDVKVSNANGLIATLQNGISYNGTPAFSTPAGQIGDNLAPNTTINTITIVAAEPDSGDISYSITSGGLPSGLTMTGNTIDGTTQAPIGTTTYNFTVTATDDENQSTDRAFNLVVLRPVYNYQIDYSAKFDYYAETYLQRTATATGDNQRFTLSFWMKITDLKMSLADDAYLVSFGGTGNDAIGMLVKTYNNLHNITITGPSDTSTAFVSDQIFRDPAAWNHIVLAYDSTQATAAYRTRLYVNGVESTFSSGAAVAQNYSSPSLNTSGSVFSIGRLEGIGRYFGGYLAEFNYIDGQQLLPTDFAADYNGAWTHKPYTGTYGVNGFYLNFGDNLAYDQSGNGNNFVANNFNLTNEFHFLDTPTNNFCTLNDINFQTAGAVSNGALKADGTNNTFSTIAPTYGKWYAEARIEAAPGGNVNHNGIGRHDVRPDDTGWDNGNFIFWREDGIRQYQGVTTTGYTTYTAGDIISVLLDFDNQKATWWKNGSAVTGFTDLAFPTSFYDSNNNLRPVSFMTRPNPGCIATMNYGQDSSFDNGTTKQGHTDENGIGDFYYQPPAGYLALCSKNLNEPGVNPLFSDKPSNHVKVGTYVGNHSYPRNIDVGFNPLLLWVKDRTVAYNWRNFDMYRGSGPLYFNNSNGEDGSNDGPEVSLTNYSNGFQIIDNPDGANTAGYGVNVSGSNHVYYALGNSNNVSQVINTDGTIQSTVMADVVAGISVAKFTGNGATYQSIGHGLGKPPKMYIWKRYDGTSDWGVVFTGSDTQRYLIINGSNAAIDTTNNKPDNSVVYVSFGGTGLNASGGQYMVYSFAEIEGFSKVGVYSGSGNADFGTHINCGFKPAIVIIKDDASNSWWIYDNARNPYNPVKKTLHPSDSGNEEDNSGYYIDFTSNGFKHKGGDTRMNGSGQVYHFIAFAEDPFKYTTGR